jgi:hypothetical protein
MGDAMTNTYRLSQRGTMHLDGAFLQGLGSMLVGIVAACGAIFAVVKRHPLSRFFRNQLEVVAERDAAVRDAESAKGEAIAWQRAAQSWKDAAEASKADLTGLTNRVVSVEKQLRSQTNKFSALAGFCQKVVEYAMLLEATLIEHAIKFKRAMPSIPPIIAADLRTHEFSIPSPTDDIEAP